MVTVASTRRLLRHEPVGDDEAGWPCRQTGPRCGPGGARRLLSLGASVPGVAAERPSPRGPQKTLLLLTPARATPSLTRAQNRREVEARVSNPHYFISNQSWTNVFVKCNQRQLVLNEHRLGGYSCAKPTPVSVLSPREAATCGHLPRKEQPWVAPGGLFKHLTPLVSVTQSVDMRFTYLIRAPNLSII